MYPVLGASLLSAAASLPLHLMPFLVLTVAAEGKLPLAQAGLIASAYMVGQLIATVTLPALKFSRLSRLQATASVAVLLVAAWVSAHLSSQAVVACWLVIGGACGALQFLGATTAAAASNKQAAFALRLSAVLFASSIAIVALRLGRGFGDYGTLMFQVALIFVALTVGGLIFYREPAAAAPTPPQQAKVALPRHVSGLAVLFLLFVGQPGFWAYAVQGAQQRGIVVEHVAYAIAFCKGVSGIVLLAGALRKPAQAKDGLFWPGAGVALGVAGMALSSDLLPFLVGMLIWELALNVLSVRFQATVTRENPTAAGPWLSGAIFLGAAAGPALHGLGIQKGIAFAFVTYSCLSALLPFLWAQRPNKVVPATP
jgi:hypothetical protein